ncbi:unnamed protein product [Cyprideis torosa]|uniref:Uncharacterized protein n=1 Tax=Cyprideis torosa TaxID=163714 RepID=A0A7R8ZQS9_9CRUS|nr:unnamed protein product [Cyprideis torosa]CAG0897131.1 unnamed protein product [Cyprideis torosa]
MSTVMLVASSPLRRFRARDTPCLLSSRRLDDRDVRKHGPAGRAASLLIPSSPGGSYQAALDANVEGQPTVCYGDLPTEDQKDVDLVKKEYVA